MVPNSRRVRGAGGRGYFGRGGVEVPILFLRAWGFFRDFMSAQLLRAFLWKLRRSPRNTIRDEITTCLGTGKRGHYERGLFTGEISRISKISRFSRISRKLVGFSFIFHTLGVL